MGVETTVLYEFLNLKLFYPLLDSCYDPRAVQHRFKPARVKSMRINGTWGMKCNIVQCI